MLSPPIGPTLDPSLRILSLPLDMLDDAPVMRSGYGLPAGALDIPTANLILAGTPCQAPLFQDIISLACAESGRDVILVHTGLWPETMDPVTIDVALAGLNGPFVVSNLIFMRASDRRLWLVPEDAGPYIEVCGNGLALATMPPFITWGERCDGVCRAAAEIVRIVARRRAR